MKNALGGLLGILLGTILIVVFLGVLNPSYPWPFSSIWIILRGSEALQDSLNGFLTQSTVVWYTSTWIIIGFVVALFSKKGWNTLRTALWGGLFLGIFSLITLLIQFPEFWISSTRNIDLFYHFVTNIIVSLFALPSAIPITMLIARVKQKNEEPLPERIETRCECGAVFKSNPLICSECGNRLRD